LLSRLLLRGQAIIFLSFADFPQGQFVSQWRTLRIKVDPEQQGDQRFDTVRTLIVGVLGVEFEVVVEDRLVRILSVWDAAKPRPASNGSTDLE
jgi:hypothetical protein